MLTTSWILLRFWAGILAGYVVRPVIWLPMGSPIRVLHYLTARAVQESSLNPDAAGDNGLSVGLLQFYAPTWQTLAGRDLDDRTSPFWSGFYGPALIADACYRSWRWWLYLRLPFAGYAALCHLWTHGSSDDSGVLIGGFGQLKTEAKALSAYLWWALLFVPLALWAGWVWWRSAHPWTAKERRELGLGKSSS